MNLASTLRPFAIALALSALPAAAQSNLLENAGFDSGLAQWSQAATPTTNSPNPLDAAGDAGSGSALIVNNFQGFAGEGGIAQCAAIAPSTLYTVGGKARIPSGQATTGYVEVRVWFFSSPGCSTGLIANQEIRVIGALLPGPTDTWLGFRGTGKSPATATSAKFQVLVAKHETSDTLAAYVDDLVLTASAPRTLTVPTSASIHGANQAFFHTDLWVTNRSYENPLPVTARYRCQSAFPGCAEATATFTLAPRESKVLGDVVAATFGRPESAGAIELGYDAALGQLSATTRTYTPSLPAPTNGTSVPALAASEATQRALFLGLSTNGADRSKGFRSNAGAYNPSDAPASVTFTLCAQDGHPLGSTTRTLAPHDALQINDVFAAVGAAGAVANATLTVTATASVFPFVTVIDNQSGDSVYAQPGDDEAPN